MFGIRGLDSFGLAHALMGIAALVFGWVVLTHAKGSASHRVWGSAYAVAMVLLNASALAIYDFNGRFNTFHLFALLSLGSLAAGWVPALLRRPSGRWYERHANNMAWSYVGLVAAFVSEIATRLPVFHGGLFGAAVAGSTLSVVGIGALLIRRRVPPIVARFSGSSHQGTHHPSDAIGNRAATGS
jgi:uncharacterized membrane protein